MFIGFLCWYGFLTQFAPDISSVFKKNKKMLLVGFAVLCVAGALLALSLSGSLSQWRESWSIAFHATFSTPKQFLIGSGPGTLFIPVAAYGSEGKAFPWFAEILVTTGIAGLAAYLFVILAAGIVVLHIFRRTQGSGLSRLFCLGFAEMTMAFFFIPFSFLLGFSFWTLLGLLGNAAASPRFNSFRLGSAIKKAAVLGLLVLFLGAWLGAAALLVAGEFAFSAKKDAVSAAGINQWMPEYSLAVSQKFLQQARSELAKPVSQQDKQLLSRVLQQALSFGKRATDLAPSRVAVWEQTGYIYKEMAGVPGALDWGVKAFQRAVALTPESPDLLVSLGQLELRQGDTERAQKELEKALAIDPYHKEAKKQFALLAEQTGDTEKAYSLLRELALAFPEDGEVLFQLGRIEYNRGSSQKAIELFRRALAFSPTDSNARYALALALEKEGMKTEALQNYEKVLQLNPDNQEVRKKIETLKQ